MLVLVGGIIAEILLTRLRILWNYRRFLVVVPLVAVSVWLGFALIEPKVGLWWLLGLIALFRILNMLKMNKPDIHPDYQWRTARRTSLVLGLATLLVVGAHEAVMNVAGTTLLTALAAAQVIAALLLLAFTAKNLQKTKHHATNHHFTDKELPTVTVAIPARNETNDLASCIRSVLANDYPKLEVLVLDDCSQDRTAEVIRDFAHDGVRFIQGDPPADRWLAKNQAYETLASHASGEIVLFCGVDVRFGPRAIRALVTTMKDKKRDMMSVLPFRIGGGVDTSLVQPLRYWWELALPRRTFNRPPVLSTCWLISRKELNEAGRFKGVSHNILPERFFARVMVKSDGYAFIRADEQLEVNTVKPIEEQLKTAVRIKYPSLRKRPENVLFLLFIETLLLLGPLVLTVSWLWSGPTTATILAALATILLVATHYAIMSASHPLHSTVALFNLPVAILTEIGLTLTSMVKYEFGKVQWKGRNICIPAMHVIKRLPKA